MDRPPELTNYLINWLHWHCSELSIGLTVGGAAREILQLGAYCCWNNNIG